MAVSYAPVGTRGSSALGNVLAFVLLLVLTALQVTWPTWLRLYGQPPDLVLAAVISLGLTSGGLAGATGGFFGAFMWAAVVDQPVGNLFISYMGLGFVAGTMRGRMFSDRLSLAAILVAASVVLAAIVNLLLAPPSTPQSWAAAVLARAVYSALISIPIYPLVRALSRFYPEPEEL